jgi:hypothetical protein
MERKIRRRGRLEENNREQTRSRPEKEKYDGPVEKIKKDGNKKLSV